MVDASVHFTIARPNPTPAAAPTTLPPGVTLIGVSGKAGVGKDYLGAHYLRALGFDAVSLADAFKLTIVGRGLATFDEVFHTKPPHIRHLLQQEGTERGRHVYGENVWVDTLVAYVRRQAEVNGRTKWYVPDVRFPNEAQGLQALGGITLRIYAPDRAEASSLTPEARLHVSETALDAYDPVFNLATGRFDLPDPEFWDGVIDNRFGKEGTVPTQMGGFLRVYDIIAPSSTVQLDAAGLPVFVHATSAGNALDDCIGC